MLKNIPCYYHPTTLLFVDDNLDFLAGLADALKDRWACKMLADPQRALKYLQKIHYAKPSAHFCLHPLEDERPEHRFTDLNIQAISSQIYNPNRFAHISVVVVDYTMPNLDGLTLCKQLMDTTYKKILLTGAADEKIAVDAFNQGLIHAYLRKDDPLLIEKLQDTIYTLEHHYFIEHSKIIADNMAVKSPIWGASLFNSPHFFDIFYSFYKKQQPAEYYLNALTGSFLFVDSEGNLSELAIVDEDIMKTLEDFTNEAESSSATKEILLALESRKKLLAHHAKMIEKHPTEWLPYLYPAQKIIFQNHCYYYSYIEQVKLAAYDRETILPYQSYLQNQQ